MKLNMKLLTTRLASFLAVFILSYLALSFFETVSGNPATRFAQAAPTGLSWQSPPVVVGPSSPEPQRLLNLTIQRRPTDGLGFLVGETGSGSASQAAGGLLYMKTNSSFSGLATNFVAVNDAATNTNKFPKLAFAGDGGGMFVWRNFDEAAGYRAYARRILPTEQLAPGIDLGNLYSASGGGAVLDMPAIAWGISANKFYLTGQVQTVPPGWGFAELAADGSSLVGVTTIMAGRPAAGNNIRPELCADTAGNVHLVGGWGYDVAASSRVNGVWQSSLTLLTNSAATGDYSYRGSLSITCATDGYAYAVWEAVRSFGIARYNPPGNALGVPTGWQVLSGDVWPAAANDSTFASVTTTPDGKVWVVLSLNAGVGGAGTYVLVSTDRGQSFINQSEADKPITAGAISGNALVYSPANNRFGLATTHAEPYISYWTNTTNPVIPPTATATASPTATQVAPTATATTTQVVPTATPTRTATATATRTGNATATVSPFPTNPATLAATASPTLATTAQPVTTATPTPTRTATATATATSNASGTATALAVMRGQLTADAAAAYATITTLAKSKPTQPVLTLPPTVAVPTATTTPAPVLPAATATPRPTSTVLATATPAKPVSSAATTTSVPATAIPAPTPTVSPLPALVIGYGPLTNGAGNNSLASNAGSNTGLLNLPALGIALPTVTPVPPTATATPEPATPTPPIGAADTGGESLSLALSSPQVGEQLNVVSLQVDYPLVKAGLSGLLALLAVLVWHWATVHLFFRKPKTNQNKP